MGLSVVSTTFTPATTGYTTGQCIGGALTLPGGIGNSLQIRIRRFSLVFGTASSSAAGNIACLFFTSALTTALADAAAPTWNSADATKFSGGVVSSAVHTVATMTFWDTNTAAATLVSNPKSVTTDASGNINIAVVATAAITYTTPTTATLKVEFEY